MFTARLLSVDEAFQLALRIHKRPSASGSPVVQPYSGVGDVLRKAEADDEDFIGF